MSANFSACRVCWWRIGRIKARDQGLVQRVRGQEPRPPERHAGTLTGPGNRCKVSDQQADKLQSVEPKWFNAFLLKHKLLDKAEMLLRVFSYSKNGGYLTLVMNPIFAEVPFTEQNPLLATASTFHTYCKERFRDCSPFSGKFSDWSLEAAERNLLRPAFVNGKTRYYSTFQVWQVYHLLRAGSLNMDRPTSFEEFDTLLKLLVSIQDYYLPQIRSDQRTGQLRDYKGDVAIGGTFFYTTTSYVVKGLIDDRKELIATGHFVPAHILKESNLSAADVRKWISKLVGLAKSIDPISDWHLLVRFISHSKRQKLKFESKFAQDLLEMAEMLRLFHSEASNEPVCSDILACDETNDNWLERRYGKSLSNPFEMLEWIVNEFSLNPTPRAIVLTEGEEWKGIYRLYESIGVDPTFTGIEIRSIGGEGNFSLQKWQHFIEYMHEKQVLVYFVVDREGRAEAQAKKLLEQQRGWKGKGLLKVIPSEDRIRIWDHSFEEDNFTDEEIIAALSLQKIHTTAHQAASFRKRKKGLISALGENIGTDINKPKLCIDLVEALIKWRRKNLNAPKRPVEKFIRESAELIVLNHLPNDPELRELNRKTGLLG